MYMQPGRAKNKKKGKTTGEAIWPEESYPYRIYRDLLRASWSQRKSKSLKTGLPVWRFYRQKWIFWRFFNPFGDFFFRLAIFPFLAIFLAIFWGFGYFLHFLAILAIFWLFLLKNLKIWSIFQQNRRKNWKNISKSFQKNFFQKLFSTSKFCWFPERSETARKRIKMGVNFFGDFWRFFAPDLAIFQNSDLATLTPMVFNLSLQIFPRSWGSWLELKKELLQLLKESLRSNFVFIPFKGFQRFQ